MAAAVTGLSSSSPAHPTQSASQQSGHEKEQANSSSSADNQQERQQQLQQDEDDYLFSCRCDSAKAVASLLSCLTTTNTSGKSNTLQPVTVFCTPTALTFHVYGTTAKQSQASVDISKGLFCHYQVVQEGEFCVNLTSVMECLGILGHHHLERTKLCVAYSPATQTFEMELLEEGGVLSTAAIPGLMPPTAPSTSLALAFSQSPVVSRILLKSEWLKQAWTELEHVPGGATTCTVAVSNKALQLATSAATGECVVSLPAIPSNRGTTLLSLETTTNNNNNTPPPPRSYPWSSFRLGMKGLDIAEETCLTINQAGMMAIQHQVLNPIVGDGEANFVDFLMACLENDQEDAQPDEDNDEEEDNAAVPPPLSLGWKSQEDKSDDEDSDSDKDDEEENPPPISAAPLFGTVVAADDASSVATGSTRTSRNVRRRHHRHPHHQSRQGSMEVNSAQQDHDDDDEPLDVTASVLTPTRRRRRRQQQRRHGRHPCDDDEEEGASSPEIGYGEDE